MGLFKHELACVAAFPHRTGFRARYLCWLVSEIFFENVDQLLDYAWVKFIRPRRFRMRSQQLFVNEAKRDRQLGSKKRIRFVGAQTERSAEGRGDRERAAYAHTSSPHAAWMQVAIARAVLRFHLNQNGVRTRMPARARSPAEHQRRHRRRWRGRMRYRRGARPSRCPRWYHRQWRRAVRRP